MSRALRRSFLLPVAIAVCASFSQAQTGTTTRIEETDKSITYTGNWYTNGSSLNSGGNAALTNATGATAVVTFTGTGIAWIGVLDPWAGMATVYLDGTLNTVDTYGAGTLYQQALFTVKGLANGPHTLSIEVTHTRDANGLGSWVWIDAFDIENGSGVTGGVTATTGRTEQNSPALTYTGVWFTNTSTVHSGGSAVLATNTGSRATINFNGAGIAWIAYRDQLSGIARVYVDGVLKATIDTYLSPAQSQTAAYVVNGLSSGAHTLTIEATGTHNPSSGESWIWVDAFDVVGSTSQPVACSLVLSAGGASLTSAGATTNGFIPLHTQTFNITPTPPVAGSSACNGVTWTVSSNPAAAPWLAITGGTFGSAPNAATVSFTAMSNPQPAARTAPITVTVTNAGGSTLPVADTAYTVSEAGSTEPLLNRQVRALYQGLLSRDPDSLGFNFWVGQGAAALGPMADSFLTSPESLGGPWRAVAIFYAATGRLPSYAEWLAALPTAGNPSPFDFAIAAPDFVRNSNGLWILLVYFTTLGRDPDPSGAAFWRGVADSFGPGLFFAGPAAQASRVSILGPGAPGVGFIGSPEFQGRFQ